MPPDEKEIVGDPEIVVTEHLGPEAMELALELAGGQSPLLLIHRQAGSGEGLAIELAVGGQGQGLQFHEGGRHGMGGQTFG